MQYQDEKERKSGYLYLVSTEYSDTNEHVFRRVRFQSWSIKGSFRLHPRQFNHWIRGPMLARWFALINLFDACWPVRLPGVLCRRSLPPGLSLSHSIDFSWPPWASLSSRVFVLESTVLSLRHSCLSASHVCILGYTSIYSFLFSGVMVSECFRLLLLV